MISVLLRLVFAMLHRHRLQTGLAFVVILLSSAMLILAINVQRAAHNPWERTFQVSSGVHIWFSSFDKGIFPPISELEGIAGTNGPYPNLIMNNFLTWNGHREMVSLSGLPKELPPVGGPVVVAGRWLENELEIVLDRTLARDLGIRIGDRVEVTRGDQRFVLVVVGLAFNPSQIPYPAMRPSRNYILTETLFRIRPSEAGYYWTFGLRLANAEDVDYFMVRARERLPEEGWGSNDWKQVRDLIIEETLFSRFLLTVFSGFALLVTSLILPNLVGGQILARIHTIGILKCLGLTPVQTTILLLVVYLGIGLVASLAGSVVGVMLTPKIIAPAADLLKATQLTAGHPLVVAAAVLAVEGIITGSVFLPAWRVGKASPIQSLRKTVHSVRGVSRFADVAGAIHFPTPVRFGLKDALTQPWRSMRTAMALTLAITSLIFFFSMESTIRMAIAEPWTIGVAPYDLEMRPIDMPVSELRQLLQGRPEAEEIYEIAKLSAILDGTKTVFTALAVGGRVDTLHYAIREGRAYVDAGEAIISQSLARQLDVRVGDELRILVKEAPVTLHLVGVFAEMEYEGRAVAFSLDTLVSALPDAKVNYLGMTLSPDADRLRLRRELSMMANGNLSIWDVREGLRKDTDEIRALLVVLNSVLLAFGIINVLLTLQLTVQEGVHNLGILKSLGFTPFQMMFHVLSTSTFLAMIATVVGVPLSWNVTRLLYDALGTQLGAGSGLGQMPGVAELTVAGLVILLVAAVGATGPGWRAARLQAVEALRTE